MLNRKQIRKIESLEITKEELEKVNEYLAIHNKEWMALSDYTHYLKRETNIQGLCCSCKYDIPTKLITYRSGFIERYCSSCFSNKDNLEDVTEHVIIKSR